MVPPTHGLQHAERRGAAVFALRVALDELEEGPFRRVVLEQLDRRELLRDAPRLGGHEVQKVRVENRALVLLEAADVRVVVAGSGRQSPATCASRRAATSAR